MSDVIDCKIERFIVFRKTRAKLMVIVFSFNNNTKKNF